MLYALDRRSLLLLLGSAATSACSGNGAWAADKLFVGDQRGDSRVVLQGANKLQNLPYEILQRRLSL